MLSAYLSLRTIWVTIRTHWVSFSILVLGFVLVLTLFYPGTMGVDSWIQYEQARTGSYSDSHPPIMAWLWSRFLLIKEGPVPMLLFHLTMFWVGLFLIWYQLIRKGYKSYSWIPLIGLLPPMWSFGGVLWKDMGLGYSLILTVGLIFSWNRNRNWVLFAGYLVLFYATAVRKNGPAATLPFFVLAPVFLFSMGAGKKKSRRILYLAAIGFTAFIMTLFFISVFERDFLKSKKEYFGQSILLHDLAYIGFHENIDLIPKVFRTPQFSQEHMKGALSVHEHDPLFYRKNSPLRMLDNGKDVQELWQLWMRTVFRYPLRYLRLRIEFTKSLLSIDYGFCSTIFWTFDHPYFANYFSFSRSLNGVFFEMFEYLSKKTYVFSGWFYVLLCVSGLAVAFIKRNEGYVWFGLVCFSSAILYTASFFPAGVACHFRYLWPVIFLAPLGWIFLLGFKD